MPVVTSTVVPLSTSISSANDVNVSVDESNVIVELEESNFVVLRKSLYAIPLAKSNTFDCGIFYSGFGYLVFTACMASCQVVVPSIAS